MVNLCSGVVVPRKRYSLEKIESIKKMIPLCRQNLINEFGSLDHDRHIFAGTRFNDDEAIITRLESVLDQNVIRDIGWGQAIRGALIDAMSADYWYKFEKEYKEAE